MPTQPDYDGGGSYKLSGFALVKIQFYALLVKRFHYMRRSKKGFLSQVGRCLRFIPFWLTDSTADQNYVASIPYDNINFVKM